MQFLLLFTSHTGILVKYCAVATRCLTPCLFLGHTHTHMHTHGHMQGAHGVFNMTSLATLHMCRSLLWEDRNASASLCLSNTFLGK